MSIASSWVSIPVGWSGSGPDASIFGAFVLGVPLFAVIIEVVGWMKNDDKFDQLAYEFTSLLSVAYATTAALGGLLAFALFTLYPTFMGYMAGIFKDIMFFYAILFFGETFALYLYYYGWKWLKSGEPFPKSVRLVCKALALVVAAFGVALLVGAVGTGYAHRYALVHAPAVYPPRGYRPVDHPGSKDHPYIHRILLNVFGTAIMQLANSWAGLHDEPGWV